MKLYIWPMQHRNTSISAQQLQSMTKGLSLKNHHKLLVNMPGRRKVKGGFLWRIIFTGTYWFLKTPRFKRSVLLRSEVHRWGHFVLKNRMYSVLAIMQFLKDHHVKMRSLDWIFLEAEYRYFLSQTLRLILFLSPRDPKRTVIDRCP